MATCKTNIQRSLVSFLCIWKSLPHVSYVLKPPTWAWFIFGKSLTLHKACGPHQVMWKDNPTCGLVFGLAYLPADYWQQGSWWLLWRRKLAGEGNSWNFLLFSLHHLLLMSPSYHTEALGQCLKKNMVEFIV